MKDITAREALDLPYRLDRALEEIAYLKERERILMKRLTDMAGFIPPAPIIVVSSEDDKLAFEQTLT